MSGITIEKREVINYLVELIREGMGLDDAHVVAYNQMIPIPKDNGIFVAVGILDSKPYASSLSYAPGVETVPGVAVSETLLEHQTLNVREVFSIHIMSRNNEARRRRYELIFALSNTRAVQVQEQYNFQIARLPIGFADSSITEAAERLNRYTITIATLSAQQRTGPVEFYDAQEFIVYEEQGEKPQVITNPNQ